jgi:VanZ family protein
MTEKTFWQTIETTGDQVVATVKQLLEAGNVRRIRIRQKDHVIAEFPLTFGVIGTVFAPIVAAIGALTAVMTECTIEVEKVVPSEDKKTA